MTFKKLYDQLFNQLKKNQIDNCQLDLDLIFCEVLELQRHQIILQDYALLLPSEQVLTLQSMVNRRSQGEPLAYIFGYKHFYKSKFKVNSNVLVPRPETELIVEKALSLFSDKEPMKLLDMGTGSGCLGLSLLKEWPLTQLIAVDKSNEALAVARENAICLGLEERSTFHGIDLINYQNESWLEYFDCIVANPPYIDQVTGFVQEHVKKYEPNMALFSDEDGFKDIRIWTELAHKFLKKGGYFLMEFGDDQCQRVVNFYKQTDFFIEYSIHNDYAGIPRYVCAQK